MERKWLPNLAELIDRLAIHQLKEVMIPEHKEKYAEEMKMIIHDIDQILMNEDLHVNAEVVHAIVSIAQINAHIWYNESAARKGESQDLSKLKLTHGLNGIRNRLMNLVLNRIGQTDRQDYKTDCLASEFKDWDFSILKE